MQIRRYYNNISLDTKQLNKHIPPANKEWYNSGYSYNKNILKDSFVKDDNTYSIMKSYLNSNFLNSKSRKSTRMGNYVKRLSTKKTFISKPEIKQTTNKAIVTLYMFDRKSQLENKNYFLLDKFLKESSILFLENTLKKSSSFKRVNRLSKSYNKSLNPRDFIYKKSIFKRHLNTYKLNYDLMPKLMTSSFFYKQLLKDFFTYSFLKWILHKNFGITINMHKHCNNCKKEYIKNNKTHKNCSHCGMDSTYSVKFVVLNNSKQLITINNFNIKNIKMVNIILSKYLNNFLYKIIHNDKSIFINNLFISFLKIKSVFLYKEIFKKEHDNISTLIKINNNIYKYSLLLSKIKDFIKHIYFKKVEFNLVNLKYLHLNSDIFMEAISIKLRKKLSLLKVLKKSLYLVKKPFKFSGMLEKKDSVSKRNLSLLNNKLSVVLLKNKNSLGNMYKYNTINNILYSLKYKWVSGIRLEARGRLTKRYTASRALFKHITKGSLKNLDKFYNTEYDAATPGVYLIRNQFKPNLQHTYAYSNKRIGTFGLKGWINNV